MKTQAELKLYKFDFNKPLDPLIKLLKTQYQEGEITNPDYLKWQYTQNPSGFPVAVVAESEEIDIVGQYLVIPIKLLINSEKIGGSLSLNTLTHIDFRGRGLFTQMASKAFEHCNHLDLKITYGFPNPNSYGGFVKKLNFTHIGDAPIYFKPINYIQIFIKKFISKSNQQYGRELLEREQHNNLMINRRGFDITTFDLDNDRELYKTFWDKFQSLYPAMVERSIDYLSWRYVSIPTRNYKLLKVVKNGRMLAFVTLRAKEVYGLNSGFIVDFCTLQDSEAEAGASEMLKAISKFFKSLKIDLIGCMMPEQTSENKLLSKSGFITVPKKLLPHNNPVIVRINQDFADAQILKDKKSWFLTFGDYDIM